MIEIKTTQVQKIEGQVLNPEQIEILIPICCREGWASCKHSVKKQRIKRNIAI